MVNPGDAVGRWGAFIKDKRSIVFGHFETLLKDPVLLPIRPDFISDLRQVEVFIFRISRLH
jgi:hypothetical protein